MDPYLQNSPPKIQKFEDFEVWQKAHQLVLSIYKITHNFPSDERFGLISQMRRAAVSVPANIAEGYKKRSLKEKAHFYNIAHGSLEELRYYLILAKDLKYMETQEQLSELVDRVGKMLHRLTAAVSK